VLGDREVEAREVAVRKHREGDRGSVALQQFADDVRGAILARE
jgi:hypothetical protein